MHNVKEVLLRFLNLGRRSAKEILVRFFNWAWRAGKEALLRFLTSVWYGSNPSRWLLQPFAYLYRGASSVRRLLYRYGVLRGVSMPVPVVVVGNITVGGTGKTPFTIWLARMLKQRGYKIGIITRGYLGRAKEWPQWVTADSDPYEVGDEPVLLARRTISPVAAGPDRVAAARLLLSRNDVDVLLSDDGLQHYRLDRAVEIAVVDGTRGLGNGCCLPAGPLREPASRLNEVDAIVVNGGDFGHGGVFRTAIVPIRVVNLVNGTTKPIEEFRGQLLHAVAGIGHPEQFFEMLENFHLEIERHPLPDHAEIRVKDLVFAEPGAVIMTEKDAVKCRGIAYKDIWYVVADLRFDEQDDERLMRIVLRQLNLETDSE